MQHVNLFLRLTHKYRDGWRGNDDFELLCDAKITPPRMVREPDGYSDGGTYIMHATVPAGASRKAARDIERALSDTLGGSSCRHEHDCCGCATGYVVARRVSRNRYVIRQDVSYNY